MVAINDILEFLESVVSIATLVEAQGPIGGHSRTTNNLQVLANNSLRLRPKEVVEIQNTWRSISQGDEDSTLSQRVL